jgi:hypothetical protein
MFGAQLDDGRFIKAFLPAKFQPIDSKSFSGFETRDIFRYLGACMPQWQVSLSFAKEIHQCFLAKEFYSSFDFNKSIHDCLNVSSALIPIDIKGGTSRTG